MALIKRFFGRSIKSEAECFKNRGNDCLAQGRFDEATACYQQAISVDSSYAEAYSNLGFAYSQLGRLQEAENAYRKALALKPDLGPAHFNLGTLLAARGDLDDAWEHCERARLLSPPNVDIYAKLGEILYALQQYEAAITLLNGALSAGLDFSLIHFNLGVCYRELKRFAEAEASFRHALAVEPKNAFAHHELALIFKHDGMRAAAEQAFRSALEAQPDFADANVHLGLLLTEEDRYVEAETAYRAALAGQSDHPEALNNLGVLLMELRRLNEAEECFRRVLLKRPEVAEYRLNLAVTLHKAARYREAEDVYLEILRDHPEHYQSLGNLGCLYMDLHRFAEAEALLRRALAIAPEYAEARRDLGYMLLSVGRLAEGWPLHETRYDPKLTNKKTVVALPQLPFPKWCGEPLQGKSLLIWYEQGFGDEIQFARYVSVLKRRGAARISLICTVPLRELFETLDGLDELYVAKSSGSVDIQVHDFWVLSMSIPAHLDTMSGTIPAEIPYLSASPQRAERWRDRLPHTHSGLRVGVVWKGNPKHKNDANRSLPSLQTLAPLWEVPGVVFVGLQKGAGEDEARQPPPGQPLVHLGSDIENFADSAGIVSQLDLVICVDTVIAHLAGALGKPCWVLLPRTATDWRWQRDRADSPWYPGVMRLFRQTTSGDWSTVVEEVTQALHELVIESATTVR